MIDQSKYPPHENQLKKAVIKKSKILKLTTSVGSISKYFKQGTVVCFTLNFIYSGSTAVESLYYIAELPENLFNDLMQIYFIDFLLFDFKLPMYEEYDIIRRSLFDSQK